MFDRKAYNRSDKIKEYKRQWQRLHRKDTKMSKEERRLKWLSESENQTRHKIPKGKCQKCEILLTSEYAQGGDENYCGDCLFDTNVIDCK